MNIIENSPVKKYLLSEEKCILTESTAVKKAQEINMNSGAVCKLAKAICVLDDTTQDGIKWQVWVQETKSSSSQISSRLATLAAPILTPQATKKITPEFSDLLSILEETIKVIGDRKKAIAQAEKIEFKLKKLTLHLLQIRSWPYKDEKKSIENIFQVFKNFIDTKHLFVVSNQKIFQTYLSNLCKDLQPRIMTLEEIGLKITTKANRSMPIGVATFDRIKHLIKLGSGRVLSAGPHEEKKIVDFGRVFAQHTYVYKSDADNEKTHSELSAAVDLFVTHVIAHDHQHVTSALLNFTINLMRHLKIHFDNFQELKKLKQSNFVSIVKNRSEIGPILVWPHLSALIWTFEILVRNKAFIGHIRTFENQSKTFIDILSTLFSENLTWQAAVDFCVFLGDRKVFEEMISEKIKPKSSLCNLNQNQIDMIFYRLNEKYQESEPLFKNEYKEMYLFFLKLLANANKLHFLKSYADRSDLSINLRQNLLSLGFSFMEGNLALKSFFGNATYRSLNAIGNASYRSVEGKGILPGTLPRKTLVKLFTGYGNNPVDYKQLSTLLKELLEDFTQGFEHLCAVVLGRLGELTESGVEIVNGNKKLIPTEKWLSTTVKGAYFTLKTYVIKSFPMKWEEEMFEGSRNVLDRICLSEGSLLIAKNSENNTLIFEDVFTQVRVFDESNRPNSLKVSELFDDIKKRLNKDMKIEANQLAVAHLTETYLSFHAYKTIKKEIDKLLEIVFKKMRLAGASVDFNERLHILANFFQAMAPFFKRLDKLIKQRFFTKGILKKAITINLIEEARKIDPGLGVNLPNLKGKDAVNETSEIIGSLSSMLSCLCVQEIQDILERCTLFDLVTATGQLENVICRKVDELSYTKEEFIQSFVTRPVNLTHFNTEFLRQVMGQLEVKNRVMEDFGQYLKNQKIPVRFILPNQALAMQLCECAAFQDRNILIKLGTGQGKSLVIAMAALHEAKKVLNKQNGRVFVFTSYDHLAKRDQELGENFFKKEGIKSICISKLDHINSFDAQVKIIYADIETIDGLVRSVMLKMLQNKATQAQINFIKTLYGIDKEEIRIILDEYDSLLVDLETRVPFVEGIPRGLLDVKFVQKNENEKLWPFLCAETRNGGSVSAPTPAADPSSGKEYQTVNFFNNGSFNLHVSVLRLSKLIERAERVIGLSGTALQKEPHCVINPLFFEIPSSQNPKVFGTRIQKENENIRNNKSCIKCNGKREFDTNQEKDSIIYIKKSTIEEYCNAIINDIKSIQDKKQSDSGVCQTRPILIFADFFRKYLIDGSKSQPEKLWDALTTALKANGISFRELTADVSDDELQRIAHSGEVTLTTIKYGRGSDIRVSLEIEEGLHVIVATPVVHKRLLQQLIGRTGRMGRKGSYSIFTIGPIEKAHDSQKDLIASNFYGALHEMTKFFIQRLSSSYNLKECKKWLLFLGNSCHNNYKIKKMDAVKICGNSYQGTFKENVIDPKFFE